MWIDGWRAKCSSQKYIKNEKIIDIYNKKGILVALLRDKEITILPF